MAKLCHIFYYVTLFLTVISFVGFVEGARQSGRSRTPKAKVKDSATSTTYLNSDIDVQLSKLVSNYDLVEIKKPDMKSSVPLCYPRTHAESYDAAIVSHVICRQNGYMSFDSKQEERIGFDPEYERLLLSSFQCEGNEQSLSHCRWSRHSNRYCSGLLAIRCTTCNKEIKGIKGALSNPGFPHAYLQPVLCEWKIEVPAEHSIELSVNYFALPSEVNNTDCGINDPHIEVTYGVQGSYSIRRFCQLNFGKNLFIPASQAKLRFFTGIYDSKKKSDYYGMNITFQGIPFPEDPNATWLKIIIYTLLSVAALIVVGSIYGCFSYKQKLVPGIRNEYVTPAFNAPNRSQLNKAFEFKMKQMKNKDYPKEVNYSNKENIKINSSRPRVYSDSVIPSLASQTPLNSAFQRLSLNAPTPKTIFPKIGLILKNGRICQHLPLSVPKTKLVRKFSRSYSDSADSPSFSESSVFFPEGHQSFEIFHSLSSNGSQDCKVKTETVRRNTFVIENLSESPGNVKFCLKNIPTIVIQGPDDSA